MVNAKIQNNKVISHGINGKFTTLKTFAARDGSMRRFLLIQVSKDPVAHFSNLRITLHYNDPL